MRIFFIVIPVALLFACNGANEDTENGSVQNKNITAQSDSDSTDATEEEQEELPEPPIEIPRFTVESDYCLPYPHERFLTWCETDSLYEVFGKNGIFYGLIYNYLITHLDSLNTKQVDKTDPDWGILEWNQNFSNGLVFKYIKHPEAGANAELRTSCTIKNRKEFYETLSVLIYSEDNVWNEDSTEYSPDGAGCHYNIELDDDSLYTVSWYCGC
ncbi:MAG: hypothetical protein HUJ25_03405 [Crocinitomicaceae bacterium]|nr:hypothetical protein [Crocinitomicaceae bacterium]